MKLIYAYLLIMNVAGFIAMGMDKSRAKRKVRRISERQLFTFAALGGAVGAWSGMRVFRHKTKHKSFVVGIPLLILLNIIVVYWIQTSV